MTSKPTTDTPGLSRGTFLKGAAAVTAAAAAPGLATHIARAQGRIEAPYVKRPPSGEALIWMVVPFTPAKMATFNRAYPDVKITQRPVTYLGPNWSTTLITGIGAPDGILFLEDAYFGQYADALYDVSSAIEPYAKETVPYKLAVAKQGGRTVAIPYDVTPSFFFYRTDIVAKAGVDVSRIRTYDDLIAAAKTVKERVLSCPTPLCVLTTPDHKFALFQLEGLAWQQHTALANDAGQLQLNTQPYTNAFTYFEKAAKAGVVTLVPFFTPTMYSTWNTGKTCFMVMADWWSGVAGANMKPIWGKMGIAPQPVFSPGDSPYSIMGGSGFVVPAKAKRPDLGALFGAFMMLDQRSYITQDGVRYDTILPSATALYDRVNVVRPLLSPAIHEHALLVKAAKEAPNTYRYPPWYSRAFPYIGPKVEAVLKGQMSAHDAQHAAYQDVLTKVVQRYR